MTNIELGKDDQYQTRDGRSVQILSTKANTMLFGISFPVIAVIQNNFPSPFTADGRSNHLSNCESPADIVKRPVKYRRDVWLNVYKKGVTANASREQADRNADSNRIDCRYLVLEGVEGGGL